MDKQSSLFQQVSLQFQPLGQIEALVLTTFGLDIEYLEKSILPAFFPELGEGPTSEPHRPLFEYLEETHTPISILYDANNLVRAETNVSVSTSVIKELRWQSFPVIRTSGCFHPKIILALTRQDEKQTLVIGSGSANLTRPGWGRNFEAFGIEVLPLRSGMRSALLEEICDMIVALQTDARGSEALERIKSAIDSIEINRYKNKPSISKQTRLWYAGQAQTDSHTRNLARWIQKTAIPESELVDTEQNWKLDVLSPYFSDTPPELISWVNKCFAQRANNGDSPPILIYCPRDGDFLDLTLSSFTNFGALEQVSWAEFIENPLTSELKDQDGNRLQRFLHAKVYRFWCPEREVIIMGSANASLQGHADVPGNDEACLVVHRQLPPGAPRLRSWLKPLNDSVAANQCRTEVINEDTPASAPIPAMQLEFDWQTAVFSATSDDPRVLDIYLHSQPIPLVRLATKRKSKRIKLSKMQVEAFFRSASVKVTAPEYGDQAWISLVVEQNLHVKPPAPTMERNIDDLLRDWQLSAEQRQAEQIARAAMPREHGASDNLIPTEDGQIANSDRLNDLFLAMYRFREDALNNIERVRRDADSFAKMQLRTRLFGAGVMSVRYLLERVSSVSSGGDDALDTVEQYLMLLALNDSLQRLQPELRGLGFTKEFRALNASLREKKKQIERQLKMELKCEPDSPEAGQLLQWVEKNFDYDRRARIGARQ